MKKRILNKIKILLCLLFVWTACYFGASLLSLDFDMDKWHFLSKSLFWGLSILFTIGAVHELLIEYDN